MPDAGEAAWTMREEAEVAGYSIWLVQTGLMPEFPVSGIFYGAHNEGIMEVPLGLVVLKGEGHVILIDAGLRRPDHEKDIEAVFGVRHARGSDGGLGLLGIRPEDVDVILLTHAHWDHMGNLAAFPNAHIYLPAEELERWMGAFARPARMAWLRGGTDPADFKQLFERSLAGQVTLVRGRVEGVLPGIDLIPASDTHTGGSQVVSITTRGDDSPWVAVGDCIFSFRNLEGLDGSGVFVPIGQATGSQERVLESFAEVVDLCGGRTDHIIPVHDGDAYRRFPSLDTGDGLHIAEIALATGEPSRLTSPDGAT